MINFSKENIAKVIFFKEIFSKASNIKPTPKTLSAVIGISYHYRAWLTSQTHWRIDVGYTLKQWSKALHSAARSLCKRMDKLESSSDLGSGH